MDFVLDDLKEVSIKKWSHHTFVLDDFLQYFAAKSAKGFFVGGSPRVRKNQASVDHCIVNHLRESTVLESALKIALGIFHQ